MCLALVQIVGFCTLLWGIYKLHEWAYLVEERELYRARWCDSKRTDASDDSAFRTDEHQTIESSREG